MIERGTPKGKVGHKGASSIRPRAVRAIEVRKDGIFLKPGVLFSLSSVM